MPENKLEIRIEVRDKEAVRALQGLSRGLGGVSHSSKRAEKSLRDLSAAARSVRRAIRAAYAALAAYASIQTIQSLADLSDRYLMLSTRVKMVSSSYEEYLHLQDRLYQIAQRTRANLEDTVTVYFRIANATKHLGVNSEDLLDVIEGLNMAIKVSGAEPLEASASLIQLSQAMSSGRLQGDELRSVLEQMPIIAEAIADKMGITVGEIRQFASEGKITTDIMIEALKDLKNQLKDTFAQTPITISDAITKLRNSWLLFVGATSKNIGVFTPLKAAILALAETLDSLNVKKTADDWKYLGKIMSVSVWLIVRVMQAAGHAVLGLRQTFLLFKIAAYKIASDVYSVFEKLLDFINKIIGFANEVPLVEKIIPDSLVNSLKDAQNYYAKWASNFNKNIKDAKKEISELNKAHKDLYNAANEYLNKVKQIENELNNINQKSGNNFKNKKKEKPEPPGLVKSPGVDILKAEIAYIQKWENLMQQKRNILEGYQKVKLSLMSNEGQELTKLINKYQEMIDVAAKAVGAGVLSFEEYNQVVNQLSDRIDFLKSKFGQFAFYTRNVWQETGRQLKGVLEDFFYDFKFSIDKITEIFRRATAQMLADLTTLLVKKAILRSFGSSLAGLFHSGGVVGYSSTSTRQVPSALFAFAPRLHDGLMPNEFPAILKKGEIVINPDKARIERKEEKPINYNIIINAVDAQSFEDAVKRNRHAIISLVTEEIDNNSGLTGTLRSI